MPHPFPKRRRIATLAASFALTATLPFIGVPAQLVAVVPAINAVAGPAVAYAGEWAQETCTQPISGLPPAPTEGWLSTVSGGIATNGCNPYNGGLVAALGDATPFPEGAGALWTYTAPAGSTIAGGEISYQLYAPQGIAFISTPNPDYQPADVLAVCAAGVPCGGQIGGGQVGVVAISHPGGTHIYASASCYGPGGSSCTAGGGGSGLDAQVNVYAATIELANNSTPAAANFGGPLLATGPVSGSAAITFTATDPAGPGIFNVGVTVDAKSSYSQTPDSNGGKCVSAGSDPAGVAEFLSQQPCRQAVEISIPVATSGLSDGPHELAVTLTDAASNSSVVLRKTITTANHTTVSAGLNSSPVPSTAATGGSAGMTPTNQPIEPAQAISLDPATQALVHGVARTYASSALTLSGTLRNQAGVPAPNVAVTLYAQDGTVGVSQPIAHTLSNAAGQWTLSAPRGPSRLLTIAYGSTPPRASTAVTIKETVTPELGLRVKALGRGRLRFSGHLNVNPLGSPRPQIVVEAGKGRHWQSVGQPVTVTPAGRYTLTYSSGRGSIGYAFQFRAVSQATSLYTQAISATRKAVVR